MPDVQPIFEYTPTPGVRPVANPMWTHYRWLWWMLYDPIESHRDPATSWHSIPQISRQFGWPGPQEGYLDGKYVFFKHGALRVNAEYAEEMREDMKALPALIVESDAAQPVIHYPVDIYLDSLAEHLRFIDPAQLAPETLEFIASRTPFS